MEMTCSEMTVERMQYIALCYLKAKNPELCSSLPKQNQEESALQQLKSLLFRKGIPVSQSLANKAVRFAPDAMISEDEAKEFFRRLIIEVTNRVLRNSLMPEVS